MPFWSALFPLFVRNTLTRGGRVSYDRPSTMMRLH